MLRNAPFLSRPIEFLVPCFSWFSVLYFGMGLKLYDWLAGECQIVGQPVCPEVEYMQTACLLSIRVTL